MRVLVPLLCLVSCNRDPARFGGPDSGLPTDPDASAAPAFGPTLVIDDLHIAGLLEDPHAFSLLGTFVNPLLTEQIDAGTLLLGLELRDVDDPALQNDAEMSVGMYALQDEDGDVTDNFDPDAPETYALGPGALVDGEPAIHFVDARLTAGALEASGGGSFAALGDALPLPVSDLRIAGDLVVVDDTLRTMEEGRLRGVIAMSLLAVTPNLLAGSCPGGSLLDVLATGCGIFALPPDADTDGDGLERLYDDDGDGVIDRCVDGDGTEILGIDCPQDPAMADGYTLIFVAHGVRAELVPEATGP